MVRRTPRRFQREPPRFKRYHNGVPGTAKMTALLLLPSKLRVSELKRQHSSKKHTVATASEIKTSDDSELDSDKSMHD